MIDLSEKVALVTGASRGIGRATALMLAESGATVVINYKNHAEHANSVVGQIKKRGKNAIAIKADVSNPDEVKGMFKAIKNEYGRLDILINNAGIIKDNLILMTREGDWDSIIDTNLKGTFNCLQQAVKIMMKQNNGKIINVSSIIGINGNAGQVPYSASKAGVIGITKSAAKELGRWGITVNTVAPGVIDTDMTMNLSEDIKKRLIDSVALGRIGHPDDVAKVILFLASNLSDYVSGQVIGVDGCQVI